jgi:hypothetical protein
VGDGLAKYEGVFYASEVAGHLDFASVHFYPKKGEVAIALAALAVYMTSANRW